MTFPDHRFAPAGKEIDAIYGDLVLRNDRLVAVVAEPLPTRNANMTVKNVGGCLIDFTTRDKQNDQLGAFFPLGKAVNWRTVHTQPEFANPAVRTSAGSVSVKFTAVLKENEPRRKRRIRSPTAPIICSSKRGSSTRATRSRRVRPRTKPAPTAPAT